MNLIKYNDYSIIMSGQNGCWYAFKDEFRKDNDGIIQLMNKKTLEDYYPSKISSWLYNICRDIEKYSYDVEELSFSLLIINTSNRCNLKCDYCYVSSGDDGEMISAKMIIRIIGAFIRETGSDRFVVLFQGGEPLLSFNEIRIAIDHFSYIKSNLRFSIQTNGTLLNESIIKYAKEKKINISVSRDGSTKQSNSKRSDYSYEINMEMNNKDNLFKNNDLKYGVLSVVSK